MFAFAKVPKNQNWIILFMHDIAFCTIAHNEKRSDKR
jgi:hypothetical protein